MFIGLKFGAISASVVLFILALVSRNNKTTEQCPKCSINGSLYLNGTCMYAVSIYSAGYSSLWGNDCVVASTDNSKLISTVIEA